MMTRRNPGREDFPTREEMLARAIGELETGALTRPGRVVHSPAEAAERLRRARAITDDAKALGVSLKSLGVVCGYTNAMLHNGERCIVGNARLAAYEQALEVTCEVLGVSRSGAPAPKVSPVAAAKPAPKDVPKPAAKGKAAKAPAAKRGPGRPRVEPPPEPPTTCRAMMRHNGSPCHMEVRGSTSLALRDASGAKLGGLCSVHARALRAGGPVPLQDGRMAVPGPRGFALAVDNVPGAEG